MRTQRLGLNATGVDRKSVGTPRNFETDKFIGSLTLYIEFKDAKCWVDTDAWDTPMTGWKPEIEIINREIFVRWRRVEVILTPPSANRGSKK